MDDEKAKGRDETPPKTSGSHKTSETPDVNDSVAVAATSEHGPASVATVQANPEIIAVRLQDGGTQSRTDAGLGEACDPGIESALLPASVLSAATGPTLKSRLHNNSLLFAALVGAIAGGCVAAAMQFWATDRLFVDPAPRERLLVLESKIEGAARAEPLARLEARLVRAEKSLQAMQSSLDALASQSKGGGAAAKANASGIANSAFEDRLVRLEVALAAPKSEARVPTSPEVVSSTAQPGAGLAVAALALAQAVDQNRAFGPELSIVEALGADPEQVKLLKPAAVTGTKTMRSLTEDFAALVKPMLASLDAAPPQGAFERLMQGASRLVRVRPVGEAVGSDPFSLVARIESALSRGALAEALQGWGA